MPSIVINTRQTANTYLTEKNLSGQTMIKGLVPEHQGRMKR